MLAPFVLELLIACTLMLLAGWAGDAIAHWFGAARRANSPAVPTVMFRRHAADRPGFNVCEFCEMSGDWLFKLDGAERN